MKDCNIKNIEDIKEFYDNVKFIYGEFCKKLNIKDNFDHTFKDFIYEYRKISFIFERMEFYLPQSVKNIKTLAAKRRIKSYSIITKLEVIYQLCISDFEDHEQGYKNEIQIENLNPIKLYGQFYGLDKDIFFKLLNSKKELLNDSDIEEIKSKGYKYSLIDSLLYF